LTSSFEEEMEAMSMTVQWIISGEPEGRVLICSDSQSLLKAIANESEETIRYDTIRQESLTWTGKLSIQLYLAHVAKKRN